MCFGCTELCTGEQKQAETNLYTMLLNRPPQNTNIHVNTENYQLNFE